MLLICLLLIFDTMFRFDVSPPRAMLIRQRAAIAATEYTAVALHYAAAARWLCWLTLRCAAA